MKLSELKQSFLNDLSDLYPSEELQSFFTILSEKYFGMNRLDVSLKANEKVSEENIKSIKEAIVLLKDYQPIQYITGETEFYGLPFKVNEYTLIPRPETEELVAWILEDFNRNLQIVKPQILDIGTGSGCIAVSLAKTLSEANVEALDFSEEAIKVAKKNALLNNTEVYFFQEDILKTKSLSKKYDLIVSNPPYVRELEKLQMQPNVLRFEPESALFVSNNDPLLFYNKIADLAKDHLKKDGALYFEINEYLSNELVKLLEMKGFLTIEVRKDIFGKDRMIKAQLDA